MRTRRSRRIALRRIIVCLASLSLLVACGSAATVLPSPEPTPQPATAVAAAEPTAVIPSSVPPSATAVPPTATSLPAATAVPPTSTPAPTADPYAELAQYTIEGLRNRSYGSGAIEIVSVLEETPNFTRYLFAYPSDGLRITGMLNRPRGDGPFPVVILNHGYYPLDAYQTGNGTQRAADYLAARGYLTLAPDFRSHAG